MDQLLQRKAGFFFPFFFHEIGRLLRDGLE